MNFDLSTTPSKKDEFLRKTAPATISDLSAYLQHGGFYRLIEDPTFRAELMAKNRNWIAENLTDDQKAFLDKVEKMLFCRFVEGKPYRLNSSLISHLTFPFDGRTYSKPGENDSNSRIAAFLTFVGQFIDHDLTLNPIDLLLNQSGEIDSKASAFIDLDSVYYREEKGMGNCTDIFNADGSFKLNEFDTGKFDLTRNEKGNAFIFDKRNDENQIILQIHILIERLHNALLPVLGGSSTMGQDDCKSIYEIIKPVRQEVERIWQSFIVHEYLPAVLDEDTYKYIKEEIVKAGNGAIKHKPGADGLLRMPHEFAIGFRMGHSQLRDRYELNADGGEIFLFDNRSTDTKTDLRGDKLLTAAHYIDWTFFTQPKRASNKIDSKVTDRVFDLPESAIPDDVKKVGNLPQRNLIRSDKVDLTSAEELLNFFGLKDTRLSDDEIESKAGKQELFKLDNDGNEGKDFRTPLWYYILKEAEVKNKGKKLGPLGSRIIGEVIYGGIYYNPDSYLRDASWKSKINDSNEVHFKDIVAFVTKTFTATQKPLKAQRVLKTPTNSK